MGVAFVCLWAEFWSLREKGVGLNLTVGGSSSTATWERSLKFTARHRKLVGKFEPVVLVILDQWATTVWPCCLQTLYFIVIEWVICVDYATKRDDTVNSLTPLSPPHHLPLPPGCRY